MLACTKHNEDIVRALVDHGASLTLRNKDGWNCFHLACREGSKRIVTCLLDKDPNIWQTTSKNGRTPLHTACKKCRDAASRNFVKELKNNLFEMLCSASRTQDDCGITYPMLQRP